MKGGVVSGPFYAYREILSSCPHQGKGHTCKYRPTLCLSEDPVLLPTCRFVS